MATDQAVRMLKIFRKKLVNSREVVDLNELEHQVSGLMKTIGERKERTALAEQREVETVSKKADVRAATESDVDQLALLLQGSRMIESPTTTPTQTNVVTVSAT